MNTDYTFTNLNAANYAEAASQGDAYAQFMLGECYRNGDGVKKNTAIAIKWYCLAAEQGNEKAQQRLNELKSSSHSLWPWKKKK